MTKILVSDPIADKGIEILEETGFDIIYNPKDTKLIKIANLLGQRTINGLDMNLMQAVEGFYLVNQFKKSKKLIAKAMING